jgi:DNA-damage-inducible protein D
MVSLGSGSQREIQDVALTRYACYLIDRYGDTTKNEPYSQEMLFHLLK